MGNNGAGTASAGTCVERNRFLSFYRKQLGWRVEHHDDNLYLLFGDGMVGVTMPVYMGKRTIMTMTDQDRCGPVVEYLFRNALRWVFLADTNDFVIAQSDLPVGAGLLNCTHKLPLPGSSISSTRWVVPPQRAQRWLPTLAAVVGAARNSQPTTRQRTAPR